VANLAGEQNVANPIDAGGEDLSIVTDSLAILESLRSAGAILTIHPVDPSRIIVIGDDRGGLWALGVDTANALYIDTTELGRLKNGFRRIVLGSMEGAHQIFLGDPSTDDGRILVYDPLVIQNPLLGGAIYIYDDIVGEDDSSLLVVGSGHTTTIAANVVQAGSVTYSDSVLISGIRSITAGTGGSGHIQMGELSSHSLDGDGAAGEDKLTLSAAGHINVSGRVGYNDPLDELRITGAVDVQFDREVIVDGDLTIHATGNVTFNDSVMVTGKLTITGANSIVFEEDVAVSGDISLEGD
jgi:hypothetical protein